MKKIHLTIRYSIACLLLLAACEKSPIDSEQYFKKVYIVGATEQFYAKEILCNPAGETEITISVATGGSLTTDKDIAITLSEDVGAISTYNTKFVSPGAVKYQKMPSDFYTIPSLNATIKPGNVYERIPIKIKTSQMHPDSLYMIPLKITSATNAELVKKDSVLLLSPKMVNEYSGSYQLSGTRTQVINGTLQTPAPVSSVRTVIALSANEVRSYHLWYEEIQKQRKWHSYVFTVNADNTVTVKPWESMNMKDSRGSYDPATKTFNIWYYYETSGNYYEVDVKLVKVKINK